MLLRRAYETTRGANIENGVTHSVDIVPLLDKGPCDAKDGRGTPCCAFSRTSEMAWSLDRDGPRPRTLSTGHLVALTLILMTGDARSVNGSFKISTWKRTRVL